MRVFVPNLQEVVVPEASHWIQQEQPEVVNAGAHEGQAPSIISRLIADCALEDFVQRRGIRFDGIP